MATPLNSARPDLGSLRIGDGQRKSTGMGRRVIYAAIPVLIFAGIVAAAYAFRSQKPVVELATAAKPDGGSRQALLNASGYITPRRLTKAPELPKASSWPPSMIPTSSAPSIPRKPTATPPRPP